MTQVAGFDLPPLSSGNASSSTALSVYAIGSNTTVGTSAAVGNTLSFQGEGLASVGIVGSRVIVSVTAADVLSLYAIGNTTSTTSSASTVLPAALIFSGAGNAAIGISEGVIIISDTGGGGGSTDNLFALGNTTGLSSSTTVTLTEHTLSAAGGVSIGYSTTAAGAGVIVVSGQTSATSMGLSAVGNTTGTTSSQSNPLTAVTISGAGIASVGFNAGSIVISATAAGGATSLGQSAVGNTTGTTSSQTRAISAETLSGAGIVSVGFNAGSVIISATSAAQTAAGLNLYAVGNTTDSTTSQANQAGSLSFDGAGAVSVGISGSSVVISAPAQSAAALNIYAVSNTTDSTTSSPIGAGSLSFAGAGAVSVGISGSSVVISAPVGAASGTAQNRFAVGNTTADSSSAVGTLTSLRVSGAGIVSVGYDTNVSGVLVISAPAAAASGTAQNRFVVGNTTGDSSSAVGTLTSLRISGAGAVSVGYDTNVSGVLIISGGATASAASMGQSVVGNTTGTTSSQSRNITAETLSGAGIVSVGFNAGSLIISAPAPAASGTVQNRFAVGNTTGDSSSAVGTLSSLRVSGAGIVSVGYDTNVSGVLVVSASSLQSAQTLGLFAIGNTAGSTTSETVDARTVSFAGSGVASVGFSDGSIVINAPAAAATNPLLSLYAVGNTTSSTTSGANAPGSLSFAGAGNVSVGISGSSVVISGAGNATMSLYEPLPYPGTVNAAPASFFPGAVYIALLNPPSPVSFNQVRYLGSFSNTVATISVTTNTLSATSTASYGFAQTYQLIHYTRNDATTFSSSTNTTMIWGVTSSWSVSRSSNSISVSLSGIYKYGAGSTTSQDTLTTSSTTNTTSAFALIPGAIGPSSSYVGLINLNIPFASTIGSGPQLFGLLSSASASASAGAGFTIVSGSWTAMIYGLIPVGSGLGRAAPGLGRPFVYGFGATATAGSTAPVSVIATALTQNAAGSLVMPWLQIGML